MTKKLFLVDDDASTIKLYDRLLRPQMETNGVDFRTFLMPEDLLKAIDQDGMPDVLVTDDRMPGMTGREIAVILRGRGYAGKILMVSGTADEKVLGLGVDELLEKPVNTAMLRTSIGMLLI